MGKETCKEGVLRDRLVSWLGDIDSCSPLKSIGRNNKVYDVRSKGRRYCCKEYFRNETEGYSSRQVTEWNFSKHVLSCSPGRSPAPVEKDELLGLSLFEFVEGDPFANPISGAAVRDAFGFVESINKYPQLYRKFPEASDSCFSIAQHIEHVVRRLDRFQEIEGDGDVYDELKSFVSKDLRHCFTRGVENVALFCERKRVSLVDEISEIDRILSPSDFGFHNALIGSAGEIVYLDFEYSGWDDPVKCVCDFFCQPDFPPPYSLLENSLPLLLKNMFQRELVRQLMPLYAVKWTCIIMNPFIRAFMDRRNFSGNSISLDEILLAAKVYFGDHPGTSINS